MKLKVWVEVFIRETYQEDTVEIPDEQWDAMTEDERKAYKQQVFEDMQNEVANGGCEEVE